MARRKTRKKKRSWFGFGPKTGGKRKTRVKGAAKGGFTLGPGFRVTLTVFGLLIVLGGIGVGFVYMERYVERIGFGQGQLGMIELLDPPEWISNELMDEIASIAGGKEFMLDKSTANTVATNLQSFAWLYGVEVQTGGETVRILAGYRKPVVMLKIGGEMYYVDENSVVLDHVSLPKLPIVEVVGFRPENIASVGNICLDEAVVSVVDMLNAFGKMDRLSVPNSGLLFEIDVADVSNFSGRKSSLAPHIVLRAKDGTEIRWGAAYGESTRYSEAVESEKIASLYGFYAEHGRLSGVVKYIDLRVPRKRFPRPSQ
ncbi:MAG: hypothetical protein KAT00_12370 [Planctomycetes bacterium]|nr:hypothetical protein [Planctomycetota bacterium]